MIVLSLLLLAGAPQPAPLRDRLAHRPVQGRPVSDPCETWTDGWQLSPASFASDGEDMPEPQDTPPDDGYDPDDPGEEQCPMLFVIPFDVWEGELWFDASAYGTSA